jgi:hypothetical protein
VSEIAFHCQTEIRIFDLLYTLMETVFCVEAFGGQTNTAASYVIEFGTT